MITKAKRKSRIVNRFRKGALRLSPGNGDSIKIGNGSPCCISLTGALMMIMMNIDPYMIECKSVRRFRRKIMIGRCKQENSCI